MLNVMATFGPDMLNRFAEILKGNTIYNFVRAA